jgi:hypothetical protein
MPNALMNDNAVAMYATRYTGPRPDRPVVNGRAVVTAEELADFRRLFGADKTLRDLLNADKALVRPGTPSAMDPRARGMQGANVAPGMPGVIPGGGAGPAAQGRIPGEVERNVMNALMALGPMMGGVPRAANAMGMVGRRPGPGDWRSNPPPGADPARWSEIVRQIEQAYPMTAPRPAEVYLQGAPTMMRAAPRPLPGVTR